MRVWLEEWGVPILIALPIVAVYVYLDRNPSFWGSILFLAGVGGLGGAVTAGILSLHMVLDDAWYDDPDQEGVVGRNIAAGFLVGAWVSATLPYLFAGGGGPALFDTFVRVVWSVGPLALAARVLAERPWAVGLATVVAVVGAWFVLWTEASGIGLALVGLGVSGLVMWRIAVGGYR